MPSGTTLRFDHIPLEDFLACLKLHETDVRSGYLPPARALKEARFQAAWTPAAGEPSVALSLFLLQETDALSQRSETFLLVHAPSGTAPFLRDLALRLRRYLQTRQTPSLFRLDPRYGLVTGSALDPVDPSIKWDRPGAYVALYFTEDPTSPSLAVMDYVSTEHRKRFQEQFQRYNQVPPSTPSLFKATFKRLLGRAAEVEPPRNLTYRLLAGLAAFLGEEGVTTPTLSLIFKDLAASDGRRVLLDPRYGAFYSSGQDRFVASLGELA